MALLMVLRMALRMALLMCLRLMQPAHLTCSGGQRKTMGRLVSPRQLARTVGKFVEEVI